jgi:hypothetical protein
MLRTRGRCFDQFRIPARRFPIWVETGANTVSCSDVEVSSDGPVAKPPGEDRMRTDIAFLGLLTALTAALAIIAVFYARAAKRTRSVRSRGASGQGPPRESSGERRGPARP